MWLLNSEVPCTLPTRQYTHIYSHFKPSVMNDAFGFLMNKLRHEYCTSQYPTQCSYTTPRENYTIIVALSIYIVHTSLATHFSRIMYHLCSLTACMVLWGQHQQDKDNHYKTVGGNEVNGIPTYRWQSSSVNITHSNFGKCTAWPCSLALFTHSI